MSNSLLPNNDLLNGNLAGQLNSQLNMGLFQNTLAKENEMFGQQLDDDKQTANDHHLMRNRSPSPTITLNGKRSIDVELDSDEPACKRLRTSSISEKDDENSCSSSSFNENQSLEDEEEVDVTSFEDEEEDEDQRSNSVNSLLSNSLSSSANSSAGRNLAGLNGDGKANSATIKKQSSSNDKQKKYACRFCSSHFDYKRSCDRHEKSIHTGERKFQCNECPNRYSR